MVLIRVLKTELLHLQEALPELLQEHKIMELEITPEVELQQIVLIPEL